MALNLSTYVEKSAQINSVKDLFDHYGDVVKNYFGYAHNAFMFFPPRHDASEVIPTCPYFNAPEEVISLYLSEKLYMVGPMFKQTKLTGRPVIWLDFLKNPKQFEKSSPGKHLFELLKKHGYSNGLGIPVFGFSNSFGYFSFSKRDREITYDDPDLILLNHVCIDLFNQYLRITDAHQCTDPKLTLREKEVLHWILKGKSNPVIAEILGISEHTVTTYIRRSAHKLGASNKCSAAVTAALMGLVQY